MKKLARIVFCRIEIIGKKLLSHSLNELFYCYLIFLADIFSYVQRQLWGSPGKNRHIKTLIAKHLYNRGIFN